MFAKQFKFKNFYKFSDKIQVNSNNNQVQNQTQNFTYQPNLEKVSNWPRFDQIDENFIYAHSDFSMNLQVDGPFRWTPLIQNKQATHLFYKKMIEFQRLKTFTEFHKKELIDAFLFEALKHSDFDYYYDYQCLPSKSCQYHGNADFLIYNKSKKVPFVPVITSKLQYDIDVGRKVDFFNKAEAIAIGVWSLQNQKALDNTIKFTRVIQTNGSLWKIYQISDDGDFKQTSLYEPNHQYKRIYFDVDAQNLALGIVQFAAGIQSENEKKLREIYDFIDERQYLTELDENSKAQLDKNKRFWKFLPRRIREFFFNY